MCKTFSLRSQSKVGVYDSHTSKQREVKFVTLDAGYFETGYGAGLKSYLTHFTNE